MVQDQAMSSTGPDTPLTKTVWTDADFESMGWHDNAIHAFACEPALPYPGRLLVDLDYIVEWVNPVAPETRFSFWVCPATLCSTTPGTSSATSISQGAASHSS
jgi:hypothetical protein